MHTATQIADWIVRFRAEAAAPVDPMSLQKLLFYAKAFHLARHGEPLFQAVIPRQIRSLEGRSCRA